MKKLIDRKAIIKAQLAASEPATFVNEDGRKVQLIPAKPVPCPDSDEMKVSLNGTWQGQKYPFATEVAALCDPAADCTGWESYQQPGKVFFYDAEEDPAKIEGWNRVTLEHIDENDSALIRRSVRIPENWSGKKVVLQFDAVFPAGRFYCNGQFLGEHLSGLTPYQKDITDLVTPGQDAVIAVQVFRKHKYVQLDMVRHSLEFAGINQDCYIFALERTHITDYHLCSNLSECLKIAYFQGEVVVANQTEGKQDCLLDVVITDKTGTPVSELNAEVEVVPGGEERVPVNIELNEPELWNDEYPNLYQVNLKLTVNDVVQTVSFSTGFRRFELGPQGARLNGNPVKFRGVNHLTFNPDTGMYTPKDWLRQNLSLMKKANVNAIRTHFLSPPALVELCDEMGIYLLQELPIDWGHTYVHEPEFLGPILRRLEGGVRRDRHHCGLMVWSIGNENMPRNMEEYDDFMNHLQLCDELVKTLDPTRPTMFPPPGPANKIEGILETRVGDIADTHYSFNLIRKFNETGSFTSPKTWDADMETFTREEALENGWSGVWFSSEYGIADLKPDLMNAPYTSVITDTPEDVLSGKNTLQTFYDRLSHEWGYMRDDSTCLGGAYFPWLCAGAGNNPWGWVRWGEDADWGVITADLLPKPFFWAMRVLFSPVQFPNRVVWKKGMTSFSFTTVNGYNAIDLKDCTLRTMQNAGGKYMTMMRGWQDVPIVAAPGCEVEITIPIKEGLIKTLEEGDIIICRCFLADPKGFRPITADILVVPESLEVLKDGDMPIGPDAILE